ncbi:hypothetical protein ACJ73_01330 [Blastomyces percursus]|uniref:Histidinol dehydrogenase n=1 Tax=Blastomyces percursus TaxID=1658174 RepID=A0A1J9QFM9_9EURO|nr:hypothetical protein ACJ73_01330 [Blastomyces percursus]
MAVGTESIRKVAFIAGSGNSFVMEAKRRLFGEIGVDPFAGPAEVLIVADENTDPFTIATDLLSQAEHGMVVPILPLCSSRQTFSTAAIASTAWRSFGEVVIVDNIDETYALANEYAFEYIQILTEQPRVALEKMRNYGAVFLGEKTCVSYGDNLLPRCKYH